jgi:SAM-dependent methyltransferase
MSSPAACRLCGAEDCLFLCSDRLRRFHRCSHCGLITVDPMDLLSPADELAVYRHHQNGVYDPAYRRFLSRLFDPFVPKLAPGSDGLDFGCGPGPALAEMFREAGHSMQVYDPYFADHPAVFDLQFDFITSTEVFEHLYEPGREVSRLWSCLKPGGLLAVMTKRHNDPNTFVGWFYTHDPTHVAYYSDQTFQWLAGSLQAELTIIDNDIIFLKKPVGLSVP